MYNMCNILIYFCNIRMKHLQYTSKIFETLATDAYNMRFQRKHLIDAWRMEARWHVEFTGGSGSTVAARQGREAAAARRGREAAASHRAWQGR